MNRIFIEGPISEKTLDNVIKYGQKHLIKVYPTKVSPKLLTISYPHNDK
jgi:hypothetical protein